MKKNVLEMLKSIDLVSKEFNKSFDVCNPYDHLKIQFLSYYSNYLEKNDKNYEVYDNLYYYIYHEYMLSFDVELAPNNAIKDLQESINNIYSIYENQWNKLSSMFSSNAPRKAVDNVADEAEMSLVIVCLFKYYLNKFKHLNKPTAEEKLLKAIFGK